MLLGPARSSGATALSRTPPSPSRRPPTRSATACAVRTVAGAMGSVRALEPLDHLVGEVQPAVGRHDAATRRADVEDHRIAAFGADTLDHGVHAALERLEQLALPGAGLGLQLLRPGLELLPLGLELLALRLTLRGAQHHGLLLEVRRRGVERGLEPLQLGAVAFTLLLARL